MKFIEQRAKRTKRLKKLVKSEPDLLDKSKRKGGHSGNAYRHTRTGYRSDLGFTFRSRWEANLARVLYVHGIKFEFEPKTFSFPIKRGTKAYIPDFYLPDTDEWIEVKGYLDKKSVIKLKRFKKYYPDEAAKLTVMISKYAKSNARVLKDIGYNDIIHYEDLSEYSKKIVTWE